MSLFSKISNLVLKTFITDIYYIHTNQIKKYTKRGTYMHSIGEIISKNRKKQGLGF
jgi:hypothetical protein